MIGYAKICDKDSTTSFRVNDKQLLKNYNKVWWKIEALTRINFESKPFYGDYGKYMKIKLDSDSNDYDDDDETESDIDNDSNDETESSIDNDIYND